MVILFYSHFFLFSILANYDKILMVIKLKREIQASVRDIVDFVYAQGDILPLMTQKNNMRDGIIIHQDIQKKSSGEKEVFLKHDCEFEGYEIHLQGRIDILDKESNKYHIIEIKSTHTFEDLSENNQPAHFAQAKFYGYMLYHYFKISKEDEVIISVLYVNKYTYTEQYFTKTYRYEELENFFHNTLRAYINFYNIIDLYHEEKLSSIKELIFPYKDYRLGQAELIDKVSDVIEDKKKLFVCAPTGIGKSLGTIYPAIKSIRDKSNKIFYLSAKSMIKDVARSAVNLMREKSNLKLKTLVITAKEKICINDCLKCNPIDCPFARNFYGLVNDAILDIFQNEDDFYFDNVIDYAKKHRICPFEFQLMLSLFSDLIICDYNYVFDIRVYLRRFFDFDTSSFILLIDEAHNMYDRVCGMFTESINFTVLHEILEHVKDEADIKKAVNNVFIKLKQYQNHLLEANKKSLKFLDLDEVLLDDVETLLNKLEKYFEKLRDKEEEINETLLNRYFDLNNFLKISEYFSDDFMIWVTNDFELNYQITCLNPRELIKMRTDSVMATVFFSATLHPMEYYLTLLGGDKDSEELLLPSPFKQDNLQIYLNTSISTKYNNRDDTKFQIAYEIQNLIKNGGKYIVYFPSYQYLDMVYHVFWRINEVEVEIIKQSRDMTESDRTGFIEQFDESKKNIVGFAVLGGVFAEGIDLKGEKLNGVCIVGVGLPMFDDFRNELREYFDRVYHKGYQYAYMYPGFNKVLQAVGRVIRDENDRGIALLIDERYASYEYLKLFPKHWSHYQKLLGN